MNVVDSSGWLEFFADGPNADRFAEPILATAESIVPTISLYEVFKAMLRQRGESMAQQAVAQMKQGKVVALTDSVAMDAAKLSLDHNLPMADSIMLATARAHDAVLWTQDVDFAALAGVRYFKKRKN